MKMQTLPAPDIAACEGKRDIIFFNWFDMRQFHLPF